MDTRTKIVPPAETRRLAAAGALVVSGFFDPLLASHAERLAEIKRDAIKREGAPLLVLIADPEDAILPARARAELVAGLSVVDYVAEPAPGNAEPRFRLEQEDRRRREELIERVHARQGAGG